jgi:hypothetical protein
MPPGGDLKTALLASIREQDKTFSGMVVAQAKIDLEGDTIVFTFAPIHKALRSQFERKRAWIAELAQSLSGRRIAVASRESEAAPAPERAPDPDGDPRQAELRARAKAEPAVQAVLDVFGGEIEDVEELDK